MPTPGALAALCLILVQVGMGIILKAGQNGSGTYRFSISASVTIAEFFKMIISAFLLFLESFKALNERSQSKKTHNGPGCPTNDADDIALLEGLISDDEADLTTLKASRTHRTRSMAFDIWDNISVRFAQVPIHGFWNLALCYALLNNTVSASLASVFSSLGAIIRG